MVYKQDTQNRETPQATPTPAPPATDLEVGGAEAYGNAAVAEQVVRPNVDAPAAPGGGEAGTDLWWAHDSDDEEVSATGANASFREEIAKPNPNSETVTSLLVQMTPANVQAARNDAALWAKVTALLSPEQLARVERAAVGIPPDAAFYLNIDANWVKGRHALQETVGTAVEVDIKALIDTIGPRDRETETVVPPQSRTVTLLPQTAEVLGITDPDVVLSLGGTVTSQLELDTVTYAFRASGTLDLTVRHPRLGDTVFPEGFTIPETTIVFVAGTRMFGDPKVRWFT